MNRDEALIAARRYADTKGIQVGFVLLSCKAISGGWVMAFEATDIPPDWQWCRRVTAAGEVDIRVCAPRPPENFQNSRFDAIQSNS
jgi:hypothetical protein